MKLRKPSISPRRIVGIQQAAEYAGVSRWLLRDWVIEGRLPAIRYTFRSGTNLRGTKIDLDDLDKFIESMKQADASTTK
jgi:excisionase family DNA binding protein